MGIDLNNRRNSTYITVAVGALFLAVLLFSQLSQNASQYEQKVQKERAQKDLFYRNSPDSPLPQAAKADFEGLNYFPIQPAYRVEATLIPAETPDTVQLLRTRGMGQPRDRMVRVGKLRFELLGTQQELTAFAYLDPEQELYFVPFRDLTTGAATYGGGRYLDVPMAQPLIMDFNQAYNPSCAYNEAFSCPVPPRENKLELEVRAGELDFRYAKRGPEAPAS
jgi:uncharacterized protein